MNAKEFVVYFIIFLIYLPFSYWIFEDNTNYEIVEILTINGFASSIAGTVVHAIFKFSYINIHRDIEARKRIRTRWLGVLIQSFAYLALLIIFREEISNSISFLRLSVYFLPMIITTILVYKFQKKLFSISYG